MGKMAAQFRSELRQLPGMLGKLLGGILAIGGFTTAVVILTRQAGPSATSPLGPLLLGILGIIVFVWASRRMATRPSTGSAQSVEPGDRARASLLSWALLLLVVAFILAGTYLLGQ